MNNQKINIETKNAIRICRASLKECYLMVTESDGTPAEVAVEWGHRHGVELCTATLASILITMDRDGRIYRRLIDWARNRQFRLDRDTAQRMGLGSPIHPSHFNQIASEFVRIYGDDDHMEEYCVDTELLLHYIP